MKYGWWAEKRKRKEKTAINFLLHNRKSLTALMLPHHHDHHSDQ